MNGPLTSHLDPHLTHLCGGAAPPGRVDQEAAEQVHGLRTGVRDDLLQWDRWILLEGDFIVIWQLDHFLEERRQRFWFWFWSQPGTDIIQKVILNLNTSEGSSSGLRSGSCSGQMSGSDHSISRTSHRPPEPEPELHPNPKLTEAVSPSRTLSGLDVVLEAGQRWTHQNQNLPVSGFR